MTDRDEDEQDLLAAELSLGLLTGADDGAARARTRTDAGFAQRVARWAGRFAPLYDEVDAVLPPDALWSRIEQRTLLPVAANDNALQRRLNRWRGYAATVTAVAAMLALVLLFRPQPAPIPPADPAAETRPLVASLSDKDKNLVLVASWDPKDRRLVIGAAGLERPSGRSHQLWVIPADGTPRSLGLLSQQPQAAIDVRSDLADLLGAGGTIAVSVEPSGGSPTGLPTGPVIASGPLQTT